MALSESKAYAVVIGGGFYGVNIALYLAQQNKGQVVLLEKENGLLTRASYHNQARVHNGYHYPRSFTTAYRSRINLPRFAADWPDAVKTDFTKLYAIARNNSKVTAKQFTRFCKEIGATIEPSEDYSHLFNNRLIEQAFLVEEYAFDASVLAAWAQEQLKLAGIELLLSASVTEITNKQPGLVVSYGYKESIQKISAEKVFNCTYSGLNQFGGDFIGTHTKLKHEVTEMALMQMPDNLKNIGITVMDGPFFSMMPFPARGLHTLSHVRYTPHFNWLDEKGVNPYEKLALYEKQTRVDRMVRDVQRYIPDVAKAEYRDSLFEVKTILVKNETDDGRPILFEEYPDLPGLYSVLGGKIDNIYDVLERLNNEV
ncbi:FAD-dependent oxidoreductase [Thiomicrospira sp. R3]|uniref:FAD-dependent oxidoreductase n=1 Tax=Thiomicrospira sp. R3 TaxID=3035472 RepID=UPI00259B0774|nr:FAD-dependent oxidoreductase [Thiomicrospira sp. R3]WFE67741.1 FAD-dependent oxidoreductase [Thiomicrospira sp. R3]